MEEAMKQSWQGAARVTRAAERQAMAKINKDEKDVADEDAAGEQQSKKKSRSEGADASATASGSGLSAEEREAQAKVVKYKGSEVGADAKMQPEQTDAE